MVIGEQVKQDLQAFVANGSQSYLIVLVIKRTKNDEFCKKVV